MTTPLRPVERASDSMSVRRVRKAYEQVADQLRDLIVSGRLARGERLPNETVLAREFGVSRATVREALRLLTAQSLIRTAKGAGGGTYVTMPTVDHVSEFLNSALELLTAAEHVTLDELLEAREALEVPAARLAAHPPQRAPRRAARGGDPARSREARADRAVRLQRRLPHVGDRGVAGTRS